MQRNLLNVVLFYFDANNLPVADGGVAVVRRLESFDEKSKWTLYLRATIQLGRFNYRNKLYKTKVLTLGRFSFWARDIFLIT